MPRIVPDAIVVLSGGSRAHVDLQTGTVEYRSTTYGDSDAHGILGGNARVAAAAILAERHLHARVITTSKREPGEPTHASIIAAELEALDVAPSRIRREEESTSTLTQIANSLALMARHGWKSALFVTNEYHVARVRIILEQIHGRSSRSGVDVVSAESLLEELDDDFAQDFARIRETAEYRLRVESETRAIADTLLD